jgi:squalene monooxygenase
MAALGLSFEKEQEQHRQLHHEAEVIVVGAGVFGCAIAYAFARQGRSVFLLEQSLKEPDRIVGELLQPGGVAALTSLGLSNCLEDIDAIVVKGYDVIYYGQEVVIPYPENVGISKPSSRLVGERKSRPEGRSFHHGRFIRRLREACAREPNITIIETKVTETISSPHSSLVLGVKSETLSPLSGMKEKDYYFGSLTVIADGYASIFRKMYSKRSPVVKSKFFALELIDVPLPAPNHGHVILGDAAPVLLYQIGTHETRALIDVPENLPTASPAAGGVKGYLKNIILPSLPEICQPSFAAALEKGKLRSMPNSWLPPSTQRIPGMVMLGDAMNMRHPLTGGGMTVAFNDAVLLSELLSPARVPRLSDSRAVQKAMREFHWRRKNLSSVINILAQALYTLFAANDRQLKALQLGCFQYFQRGGRCVDDPAGLLGGIIRQPFVLFYHFFAVAFLSIWILLGQIIGGITGIWKSPYALLESVLVFWKACVVIFPFIFSEMRP